MNVYVEGPARQKVPTKAFLNLCSLICDSCSVKCET